MSQAAKVFAIVTAGSTEKQNFCTELGANLAINYKEGPFAPKVLEATGGKGVNVILDFVGGSYWQQNLDSLAVDGRLILIGLMGGSKGERVGTRNYQNH